ncbi:hypothetical protein Droror1_Dr00018828 [Drosera rotundifolia]
MEGLIRQIRVRFADIIPDPGRSGENKTSPQRTQWSGDRRTPRWFDVQFLNQMRTAEVCDDIEYAAAVAAATYAVNAIESTTTQDNIQPIPRVQSSLATTKSKRWDLASTMPEYRNASRRNTDGGGIKNSSMEEASDTEIASKKPIRQTTSLRKTTTFADEQVNDIKNKEPETIDGKPVLPSGMSLPPAPPPPMKQELASEEEMQENGTPESEVDAWERTEMTKIKQRFDRLRTTIVEWEEHKKKKAKDRLNKTERKLERLRANALQHYQLDMERINQIAQGARTQVEEEHRNEELKVKEKAHKFLRKGQNPTRCLCF